MQEDWTTIGESKAEKYHLILNRKKAQRGEAATKHPLPMNLPVAAGILPAVKPWLPARRKRVEKLPARGNWRRTIPGGRMPALYGRQDARCYIVSLRHSVAVPRGEYGPGRAG
jgi:hypothetical protein